MPRLIDADALMRMLCVQCDAHFHEATCEPDECFVYNAIVYDAPTIEAEPVRHGRWIPLGQSLGNPFVNSYKCSACDCKGRSTPHYCPNCGAKMDGVVSDD